jgi:hypothetical protein
MGLAARSNATALQRMAEVIDLSHIVASTTMTLPSSAIASNLPRQLDIPPTINLFGPITELRVGIPCECDVTIEVADDAGAPLFLAEVHMPAGWQKVGFSGRDSKGALLRNGTYYYTVTADGTSRTTRVVVNR